MKKSAYLTILTLIAISILYTSIWFFKANHLKQEALTFLQTWEEKQAGLFSYEDLFVTGFPFNVEIALKDPHFSWVNTSLNQREELNHAGTLYIGSAIWMQPRYWLRSEGLTTWVCPFSEAKEIRCGPIQLTASFTRSSLLNTQYPIHLNNLSHVSCQIEQFQAALALPEGQQVLNFQPLSLAIEKKKASRPNQDVFSYQMQCDQLCLSTLMNRRNSGESFETFLMQTWFPSLNQETSHALSLQGSFSIPSIIQLTDEQFSFVSPATHWWLSWEANQSADHATFASATDLKGKIILDLEEDYKHIQVQYYKSENFSGWLSYFVSRLHSLVQSPEQFLPKTEGGKVIKSFMIQHADAWPSLLPISDDPGRYLLAFDVESSFNTLCPDVFTNCNLKVHQFDLIGSEYGIKIQGFADAPLVDFSEIQNSSFSSAKMTLTLFNYESLLNKLHHSIAQIAETLNLPLGPYERLKQNSKLWIPAIVKHQVNLLKDLSNDPTQAVTDFTSTFYLCPYPSSCSFGLLNIAQTYVRCLETMTAIEKELEQFMQDPAS